MHLEFIFNFLKVSLTCVAHLGGGVVRGRSLPVRIGVSWHAQIMVTGLAQVVALSCARVDCRSFGADMLADGLAHGGPYPVPLPGGQHDESVLTHHESIGFAEGLGVLTDLK